MNKMFITGIILAGGGSKRLKPNKLFLKLSGKSVIENLIDNVKDYFEELLIATNFPHFYNKLNLLTFSDKVKGKGPLAGIYTGLFYSRTYYNFFLAGDMPFVRSDLIKYMQNRIRNFDVVVPKTFDGIHPLFGIYTKACIPFIKEQLKAGDLKITNFYSRVKVNYIKEEEIKEFNPEISLFNLNTMDDYKKAKEIYRLQGWKRT